MLKARTSFPSVIYENNEYYDEPGQNGRVADIMARYYTKIGKIVQAEIMKQNELANTQPPDNSYQNTEQSVQTDSPEQRDNTSSVPDSTQPDITESLDIIKKSKQKVKLIDTAFNRTDDDMKKLEREGQILSMVRRNLDNMTRKFWD